MNRVEVPLVKVPALGIGGADSHLAGNQENRYLRDHDISEAIYLFNRLVVVAKGPTRVFDTVPIDVGYPRGYEDDRLFELIKK